MECAAIVTGASRGIGRAAAIRLARDSDAVVLVARTRDTLAKTADDVRAARSEPLVLSRDLGEPNAAGTVVTAASEAFGRIDALACIAGAVPQIDRYALTDGQ